MEWRLCHGIMNGTDCLKLLSIHHLEADIFDFRKQRFIFLTQLIMIIIIIYRCVPALMKVIFFIVY
ncbi:hypothetical protein ABE33_17740 [Bacillus safensis]|nr:hypothetical protein [Bacillus safensis]MBG9833892.1 hypothetical protein [Bacillus safensis]MBG9862846.1 hypothetical protein [Bacillus safensis]